MKDKKSGTDKPEKDSHKEPGDAKPKPEMKANPRLIGRSILMSGATK